jgi:hypothetical protein
MKLYVDDIRACPEGWIPARTVTEAIRILATMPIQEVSLDHDIACYLKRGQEHTSEESFEPVARYIALMNPRPAVRIHTANYPAGDRMAEILGIEYTWPSE